MPTMIAGSVAAAGTRQRVSATDPTWCSEAIIQNTDAAKVLYVGDVTVDSTHGVILDPGESFSIGVGNGENEHNLYKYYVDASVNGCTFVCFYTHT